MFSLQQFCRPMLFWSQLYMIGFSASQLFYTYFLLIFPLLNSDFWMFCFWSEPILQRTFDLWRFFMMQDVSSIYDLFDPKLREISAKHHFMTCTTHSVCHKVCKDIRLNLVKLGKNFLTDWLSNMETYKPNLYFCGLRLNNFAALGKARIRNFVWRTVSLHQDDFCFAGICK